MTTLSIRYDSDGTYHKTGGPENATVGSNGDIDLESVAEDNIVISWTLNDGKTFKEAGNSKAVTITGNGNGQIFTSGTLSADKKTYTVTDANNTGATDRDFSYVMHENLGDVDPSIKNRR